MMLANRGQRYVSYENHLAVTFLKPYVEVSRRVFADPGEEKLVGPDHPRGRFPQPFSVGVLPYGEQYLPDGTLDPDPVDRAFREIGSPRNLLASAPREGRVARRVQLAGLEAGEAKRFEQS